jgi:hypothetical protein
MMGAVVQTANYLSNDVLILLVLVLDHDGISVLLGPSHIAVAGITAAHALALGPALPAFPVAVTVLLHAPAAGARTALHFAGQLLGEGRVVVVVLAEVGVVVEVQQLAFQQ